MRRRGSWMWWVALGLGSLVSSAFAAEHAEHDQYAELLRAFEQPDHARFGEVPLWWWEGDRLDRERVTWQLETLASQGVKSVCPIQRSPARCDPPSFTPAWWEMLAFVHDECRRLGMTLWAYDQIGYGHYGWLEKAAAQTEDRRTARVVFLQAEGTPTSPVVMELPAGTCLGARAYPLSDGEADDERSIDLADQVSGTTLRWTPREGTWRVAVSVAVPEIIFQLSDRATDAFLDMLYGEVERRLGREAMGRSFVGMFQDEHPSTPRDVYTDQLANVFRQRHGYELGRAIPALHFDVGPKTPKYRSDFFDTYLSEDERCYWRRVFDWAESRGWLTSHDNWGRNDLPQQSFGYIDYFRTQRWFSAPGYDDAGQAALSQRNYYDTKIAASIARLYRRPRVWAEVFHSSGWGRTTQQTLSWLSANYVFGANLYDEHGLYYSARAATWEHAAPDPHWRQPYWRYYHVLSDWVARMSFIMSQGTHVTDVAVHYPVASLLAGHPPDSPLPDYNQYMRLSRTIFDAAIDNDIVDDDSLLAASVDDGRLLAADNHYQALVFGPLETIRLGVLEQAVRLAESGGCVVFFGRLPSASTDAGRNDPRVAAMLQQLLGDVLDHSLSPLTTAVHERRFPGGGRAFFIRSDMSKLAETIRGAIDRDVAVDRDVPVWVAHRRVHDVDAYLVQNRSEQPVELDARFRAQGTPEWWDAFTGEVRNVDWFEPSQQGTLLRHRLEGNTAQLIVFRPGTTAEAAIPHRLTQPESLSRELPTDWSFSVIPTRDNRWGEFHWPPSDRLIGPEIRTLRYTVTTSAEGRAEGWQDPQLDDSTWSPARYSIGPYWLYLHDLTDDLRADALVTADATSFEPGRTVAWGETARTWETVEFSQTIGLARPAPWGGHSGYPDGAVDQNFVELPEGRNILFTRLHAPREMRLGLRIALRQSGTRLWVNGVEQPIEGAVGNLPLQRGVNTVLLELLDGGHGMLYVQSAPPSIDTLQDAARSSSESPLADAQWIQVPDASAGYLRREFELADRPREARLIVTGYTGYRLFVNGQQVEEDIGPWAKWTHPETVNVAPYLRAGKNVIAAWVQVHVDQNVRGETRYQALACALQGTLPDGTSIHLLSDGSWRCSERESTDWQTPDFDDSDWGAVRVLGPMGIEPYGTEPLDNVGAVTEPRRRLAIELPSPYLTCFEEVPEVIYDVFAPTTTPVGWYRFEAPPGLHRLRLGTDAAARVWVDGREVAVRDGIAEVAEPPRGKSCVAIQMPLRRGAYGGAAFPDPIGVELRDGTIQQGRWSDFALETYAGIGVYRQTVTLTEEEARRTTELDLGEVLASAELLVNGHVAGVRLASPFRFDITRWIRAGDNQLEVRVANTLAPHYLETNQAHDLGPTDSGLLGPVTLRQQLPAAEWTTWATGEIERLHTMLATPSAELVAAQQAWEAECRWITLAPDRIAPATSTRVLPDGSALLGTDEHTADVYELEYTTREIGITGVRLEALPHDRLPGGGPGHGHHGHFSLREIRMSATALENPVLRGRRVRLQIQGKTEFLHVAEVQVISAGRNVAPDGVARQSSTAQDAIASRAIDGNTDGSWAGHSVCHTNFDREPWWEVDLGDTRPVERIVIWNRTDGPLEDRLVPLHVSLLDEQGGIVWQELVSDPPAPSRELYLSPVPLALRRVDRRPPGTGPADIWTGPARGSERDGAIFEVQPAFGFEHGTRIALRLAHAPEPAGRLGRLRLSVTRMPTPPHDIPPEIERIVSIERQLRSPAESAQLAAFHRQQTPLLQPIRARLAQLEAEVARITRQTLRDAR